MFFYILTSVKNTHIIKLVKVDDIMKGRIIVIEGTDCSGKETQASLLVQRLKREGKKIERLSFPMYDTPTGQIVGGPYLGKDYISPSYFKEGAPKVDPKVAALYYAADRRYNFPTIKALLDEGYDVLLDRYVESNMAHQGGKIYDAEKRHKLYEWLDTLEYKLLELEKPSLTIFLHMPYKKAAELKKGRHESLDQHESSELHLKNAENAYLELADIHHYETIKCVDRKNNLRPIEEIHEEIYKIIIEKLY